MKRFVTLLLAGAFLLGLGGAVAGAGGSASDPFISRSYVDGTYKNNVVSGAQSTISSRLNTVYSDRLARLEAAYASRKAELTGSDGYAFAAASEPLYLPAGATLKGLAGAVVVPLSGRLTYKVSRGALIDVSAGEETAASGELTAGVRYLCAEETEVVFTAAEDAYCTVRGRYQATGAEPVFTAYTDVSPAHWFYHEAKYIYDNDLYYDARASTFRESEPVTRATFVYALWKLSGAPKPTTVATFKDLKEDWYVAAVTWAAENAIVEGYSAAEFGPADKVTREQIACLMYRYARFKGTSLAANVDLAAYTDAVQISDWALTEMKWANVQGLITGVTKTTLEPQGTATRAQVAAIIMRYAT